MSDSKFYFYAVTQTNPWHEGGWRVGALHETVYNGVTYYSDPSWGAARPRRDPGPYHVTRSGSFVPEVFYGMTNFIVSPRVQRAFTGLSGIAFKPVVFEHLVDLPMPPLGDFSWFDTEECLRLEGDTDQLLRNLPHEPRFEKKVEGYMRIAAPQYEDILDKYADFKTVSVNRRDYADFIYRKPVNFRVSGTMLREHHIIWCYNDGAPFTILSVDAFKRIAPFLNRDFCFIDVQRVRG